MTTTIKLPPDKPIEKPPAGYYWGVDNYKWVLLPSPKHEVEI